MKNSEKIMFRHFFLRFFTFSLCFYGTFFTGRKNDRKFFLFAFGANFPLISMGRLHQGQTKKNFRSFLRPVKNVPKKRKKNS